MVLLTPSISRDDGDSSKKVTANTQIFRLALLPLVILRYYNGEPLPANALQPKEFVLSSPLCPLFPDLHLRSGPAEPGEGAESRERHMRIEARGEHGSINLTSDSLRWTSSSSSPTASVAATAQATGPASNASGVNPSGYLNTSYPHHFVPSFRVDGHRLEAGGFSDAVRLSAARLFNLAVISAVDGAEKTGDNNVGKEGESRRMGQEWEQRSRLVGSRSEAALLRGDLGSMNASAGFVSVEVTNPTVRYEENLNVENWQNSNTGSLDLSPRPLNTSVSISITSCLAFPRWVPYQSRSFCST